MEPIRVVVHGAVGKMGQQVLSAVCDEDDLRPVGAADTRAESDTLALPDGSGTIPLASALSDVLEQADVVVDFTSADGAMAAIRAASARRVNVVVGTTGIPKTDLREAESLAVANEVGVIVAPNFAMGAVLMMHLARVSGRFFDYADLVETHHEAKTDAPSGTALAIARAASEGKGGEFITVETEKEILPRPRGASLGGVSIHSARMPGRVAHHELVFGTLGQTLTIRHDSINRESFMPGVVMAIRAVGDRPGLTVGLDKIMGLHG